MNLEYSAKPDKQSFSCHSYLSEDKYHTQSQCCEAQVTDMIAELRHETQSVR